MSADNSCSDGSIPLRNLLNSVRCIRDRVKDGESNESDGEFNLPNFWDTLTQAAKATSQEATKLSLAFSKPPLPSLQDGERLAESIQKTILALSTVYYWFPKSQGITLRRIIRDATAEVLDGVAQLIDVILTSPLQSLSQEQLVSTGGVWSSCDHFAHLPKDNQEAVLSMLASYTGVVKDAIEEMEQAQTESQDPFSDVLDDEELNSRGNQDTYWSESDRQLLAPCQGLMKASAACLRKLSAAVRSNGKVDSPESIAQLDDLADIAKDISPSVDDLALSLYPPVDYSTAFVFHSSLCPTSRNRASHVCLEADQSWVEFLGGAVEHNLQKAKALTQGPS
uniref:Cyclin D-type binding-protein 1 n=1 Tax=Scleropages formosus TaxID=113540 RepID=A0A8C9TPD5_SCLFO